MRETHSEEDVEIQAFWKWATSPGTRRPGIGGSSHGTQRHFILQSAVKEYLGAPGRVEDLLAVIFRHEKSNTIDADVIRQHYLRPLAILLLIGKGPMIKHFVQYRGLQDQYLPFQSRTDDFPFSVDANFFDNFFKQQWQFCATDLEYNIPLRLREEEILPITHKEEVGHGGNAVVFKINVHEEYNKLVPQHWKMPERPAHLRDTFVLKTYRGADAKEQYTAEREAYMKLRYDNRPSPFVLAYYGSFIDSDTYNIILEYADRGNLEQYLKLTHKPPTFQDMIVYWERFSNITHGLAAIHGVPGSAERGTSVLLGWHQDIKPANILVFSGSGESQYDVHFKIADLSLCHFKQSDSLQHDESDLDAIGTRAYGAPETFRPDDGTQYIPVQVRPGVDIWSIGCVFSEVAVWSRFGWERVTEYRRLRQAEVKQLLDFDGEELFHDGRDVLQAVQDMHEHIRVGQRDMDIITIKILRLLEEDMLLQEHEPRCSAKQVFHKSRRIITNAVRKMLENTATDVPSRSGEDRGSVTEFEEEPKTPPQVPPGYASGLSSSAFRPTSGRVGTFSSSRPLSIKSIRSDSPSLRSIATFHQYQSRASGTSIQDQQNGNPLESLASQSVELHELPDPHSPASSYKKSSFDKFKTLSINTKDLDNPQVHRRLHRETVGDASTKVRSLASKEIPLRRNKTEKKPSSHRRRNSNESLSGPHSEPSSPVQSNQSPPSSSSKHDRSKLSLAAENKAPSEISIHKYQEEPQRPHVSLQQGLLWKQRKKEGTLAELDGHENLTSLYKRDHIFVIDNSESMQPHRKDVLSVVSFLAYLLKDTDDDGLDVRFTQSTERKNAGKTSKLLEVVSKVAFKGISDMRTRLSQILQEHKNKFGTKASRSGSWYKRYGPRETQKPLSFYILTDGRWQPNEVGPIIVSLVESMKEHKLHKDHVGIQFIRFGQDPKGIDRLNHLDHGLGLGLKEIDMDIVDTTSWNGNIWKQLLGAISSWYDDDPD